MIWLSLYMCCRILMLISGLFSRHNGHITRKKAKALKEIVFYACPLTDVHTHALSRPDSSPFVSRFFFSSFLFFFLLHFSILDNTPRIDIKQE